jgi:hypothetical protein
MTPSRRPRQSRAGGARRTTALAAAAAFVVAAATRAEGPLAIHAPPLLVPEETAGSGLSPEAAVRLSIDERGLVTAVEVLSIEPASEHDGSFREALQTTLARWRFAPAVIDGRAQKSSLDWRVRFPAKPPSASETLAVDGSLDGGDAELRRSRIRALPAEQRSRLLAAQIAIASRALAAGRATRIETPRFVVHTDATTPKLAETVGGNLEAIFNVLAGELLPGIELRPEPYKLHVFVYRDRASYELLRGEMPTYEWSAGFYSPAGMIALHLDQPDSDAVMSILLHEATHAFIERHVVRPGVAIPRWLGEGFAEYVGNSVVKDGRLLPGRTMARRYVLVRGRAYDMTTGAGVELQQARQALRGGQGLGVSEMLAASPEIFYGERSRLFYASSWLLVHYLRDGGEGWARARFPRLLLYLAEGYPQAAAFRAVYGDVAAADTAFRAYVKAF